jgi:hypothetical protein
MPEHSLGDDPVPDDYKDRMTAIIKTLDQFMNGKDRGKDRKVGVVLLIFPFGYSTDGRCNFMSNGADRNDVVALFKEMIARFEGQPEQQGRA